MNIELAVNSKISGLDIALKHESLPHEQVLDGNPTTAICNLGQLGEVAIGIWEHSVGSSKDIETDEFFVVLAGRATIEFVNEEQQSIEVGVGDIVRLAAGTATRWTIHETLRKVYLSL